MQYGLPDFRNGGSCKSPQKRRFWKLFGYVRRNLIAAYFKKWAFGFGIMLLSNF